MPIFSVFNLKISKTIACRNPRDSSRTILQIKQKEKKKKSQNVKESVTYSEEHVHTQWGMQQQE